MFTPWVLFVAKDHSKYIDRNDENDSWLAELPLKSGVISASKTRDWFLSITAERTHATLSHPSCHESFSSLKIMVSRQIVMTKMTPAGKSVSPPWVLFVAEDYRKRKDRYDENDSCQSMLAGFTSFPLFRGFNLTAILVWAHNILWQISAPVIL